MKKIIFFICGMIMMVSTVYATDSYTFNPVTPTAEVAGSTFTVDVVALQQGGQDATYNGNVSISAIHPEYGPIAVTPNSLTISGGIASGVDFMVEVAGEIDFVVTDSTLTSITSWAGHITIQPNSPDHFLILRHSTEIRQYQTPGVWPGYANEPAAAYYYGVTVTAGTPVAVSVVAVDEFHNTVDSSSGTFDLDASDHVSSVTPSGSQTAVDGIATFSWVPNPPSEGQWAFSSIVGSGDYSGLQTNSSPALDAMFRYNYITIPDTFHMWVDVPNSVYAGVPFSVTLTASDSNVTKSPVPGASGYYFRIDPLLPNDSAGHGTLTPTNLTIGSGGYKQAMFTYTTAEYFKFDPVRITPTDGKTIEIASSPLINVMAGAPTQISVAVSPESIEAGHTATIAVTVMDAYQNVVSGVPVQFTKTVGSDDATVSPATVQSGTDGIARATFTGGIINEVAEVRCKVNAIESDVSITISVAPPSGDKMINYPNPLNPNEGKTSLNYYLNEESDIEIRVFDAFGRLVFSKDIAKGQGIGDFAGATIPGGANFNWDGCNGEGRVVGNGIYLIKVKAKGVGGTQEFERRVGVVK